MIPFNKSLPYDIIMGDVFAQACPFCGKDNVLLPMKTNEVKSVREGKKKLLVFPCCGNKLFVLDSDNDYLLTDKVIRR
ncbi:hypothetical protein [Paenibacillus segetis]|uniref:Uncharacterized protein n=1 Tax=Paenibacillus segetis TaxID=1325360 RepID=A0ABQ1YQD2_9BACL|nr:hypothetical protein [Paenibacillus segetis]GGH34742.1 hypothetical protein GCM10008013_40700 [Paenibacillus segetis]